MALDDTARRFFHAPNLIHVATLLPSGAPHSVPVWCRMEGGRIAFFSQPATRKARNLALDPRVAISAVSHENPYSMVQVRGRVDETLEGEAALAVIDRISQDYIGARSRCAPASCSSSSPTRSSTWTCRSSTSRRGPPTGPRASVIRGARAADQRQRRHPPRGPQRAAARGRGRGVGAAAHPGRRGLGQDPRPHAPDRPRAPHEAGAGGRDPRDHVHQQGGAGDARARRAPRRPRDPRDVGDDVPLGLRPDAARGRRQARLHPPVHDLRLGRPAAADQEGARRPRHRSEALHAARDAGPDLRREEQAPLGRGLPPAGRLLLRADGRRRLRGLPARAPPRQRDGLRRPPLPRGRPAHALPGGPRPLHQRLPVHPRRRVPGHERRPVPLAPAALLRAPQPRGGRRRCAVPGRGHAGDDGRRHGEPIEEVRGRRGAVVPRQRRLPAGAGDAHPPFRPRDEGRDHDPVRAAHRQHARARALRGLQAAGEPAAAHDLPAVAAGHGLPGRHDADVAAARGRPAGERGGDARDAGARGRGVGALDARDGSRGARRGGARLAGVPAADAPVLRPQDGDRGRRGRQPGTHRPRVRERRHGGARPAAAAGRRPRVRRSRTTSPGRGRAGAGTSR